jgi:DNA-directed RNA polymerase specialized sigma24 family protein
MRLSRTVYRVRPTDAVIDTVDPTAGPERLAEEALRRLVADVSGGLSADDRAILRLYLHGLEGAELGSRHGCLSAPQSSTATR